MSVVGEAGVESLQKSNATGVSRTGRSGQKKETGKSSGIKRGEARRREAGPTDGSEVRGEKVNPRRWLGQRERRSMKQGEHEASGSETEMKKDRPQSAPEK